MTDRVMTDSDNVAGLPSVEQLAPAVLVAVATYTPAQITEAAARFPGIPVLQVNVGQADQTPPLPLAIRVKAEDVESGALNAAQAAAVVQSNPDLPFLVYSDLTAFPGVASALGTDARAPGEWPKPGGYYWIADPGPDPVNGQPHCPEWALACQYRWAGPYDISLINPLTPEFFPALTAPATPPPPPPPPIMEDIMFIASDGHTEWAVANDLSRKIALNPAESSSLWASMSDKDQSAIPLCPDLLAKIPTVP